MKSNNIFSIFSISSKTSRLIVNSIIILFVINLFWSLIDLVQKWHRDSSPLLAELGEEVKPMTVFQKTVSTVLGKVALIYSKTFGILGQLLTGAYAWQLYKND